MKIDQMHQVAAAVGAATEVHATRRQLWHGMSLDEYLAFKPASTEILWPPGAATLSDEALAAVAVERFQAVFWACSDRRDHYQVEAGFWAAMRTPQALRTEEQRGVIHHCFELQEKLRTVGRQLETLRRVLAGEATRAALAVVAADLRKLLPAQERSDGTGTGAGVATLVPEIASLDGGDGGDQGGGASGAPAALAGPRFDPLDFLASIDLDDDEDEEQQHEHEVPRP